MRVCVWRAWVVVVVVTGAVVVAAPQRVGVQVDNNVIFTAGLGVLLAGLAFHAGRKSVHNQQTGGSIPTGGFSGGFFPFRRRRQVAPNKIDPWIEKILEVALENDKTGCVLQLTCTLGGTPEGALTGHLKDLHTILSTAGGGVTQGGVAEYGAAMSLGRQGGDCDRLFPGCLTPSSVLIQYFQTMNIAEYYR